MFEQLGVIGCGLMGGSFALAMKRAGMVRRVIGYSKSPSTTEQAKRLGVIDTAAESALLNDHLRGKGVNVHLLLSNLITHAEVNKSATATDTWKLISFWASLLRQ